MERVIFLTVGEASFAAALICFVARRTRLAAPLTIFTAASIVGERVLMAFPTAGFLTDFAGGVSGSIAIIFFRGDGFFFAVSDLDLEGDFFFSGFIKIWNVRGDLGPIATA